MIDCRYVRDDLKAWADGELSPLRRAIVRRHLGRCAACREEVEAMGRIKQGLVRNAVSVAGALDSSLRLRILDRMDTAAAIPSPVPAAPPPRPLRLALAASVAVNLLFVVLISRSALLTSPPTPAVTATGAPTPITVTARRQPYGLPHVPATPNPRTSQTTAKQAATPPASSPPPPAATQLFADTEASSGKRPSATSMTPPPESAHVLIPAAAERLPSEPKTAAAAAPAGAVRALTASNAQLRPEAQPETKGHAFTEHLDDSSGVFAASTTVPGAQQNGNRALAGRAAGGGEFGGGAGAGSDTFSGAIGGGTRDHDALELSVDRPKSAAKNAAGAPETHALGAGAPAAPVAPPPAPAAAMAPPEATTAPVMARTLDSAAAALAGTVPQPVVPADGLRAAGHECVVTIDVDVSGAASGAHVKQSSGSPTYDTACLTAALKARYHPALRDGRPHAGSVEVRFAPPD